jgi:hypothetical protein
MCKDASVCGHCHGLGHAKPKRPCKSKRNRKHKESAEAF